jgi:tRNA-binding protein
MTDAVKPLSSFADFEKLDIRVGRIVAVDDFPEARKPAWKLTIDFGALGLRRSSAQLVARYSKDDLLGRLVMGVVNFPPRRIGPFVSEVLTLGVPDESGDVVLVVPQQDVPLGGQLF